jgi:two-component system, chemotaxis family, protein-glutamate methylesterase/glutaminase
VKLLNQNSRRLVWFKQVSNNMTVLAKTTARDENVPDKIKVMIVDDSIVIRGLIGRWLDALPDIDVVARCRDGKDAVDTIARVAADVVVLDIEMPVMDGLTALPKILKECPKTRVLMASTLTRRNAGISIKALTMGATDYVPKPESTRDGHASAEFQQELIDKIRALGSKRTVKKKAPRRVFAAERTSIAEGRAPTPKKEEPEIKLQKASSVPPRILAVGSSTGGPKALFDYFSAISPALDNIPVVITQHMPPTFTAILAEHISACTKRECVEGEDGMAVEPGKIYVAPGGKHMLLKETGKKVSICLDDGEAVNFCKPAVDPMLDSLLPIYGSAILTCILTGMGHDGRDGSARAQKQGGTVIAQDEETSVVWGMPGAVAQAGVCHKVLPLKDLATATTQLIKGGRV